MMTIQEMLLEVKLPHKAIGLLVRNIQDYNKRHPDKPVPELDIKEPVDQLLMAHLPFVGRAIAEVRGDDYLDSEGKFSLTIDENALRYAAYKLDKYYRKN